MQIYTVLHRSLPNQNSDRWLEMYFKTSLLFFFFFFCQLEYEPRGGIIALYIHNGKMATKRGQMCELEMRAMWSLPFLDLYLGPVKRVMTIKGL